MLSSVRRLLVASKDCGVVQGWSRSALRPMSSIAPVSERPWQAQSRRTGVVGVKVGMMAEFLEDGTRFPVTVVHFPDVQVVQVKTREANGYTAVQVGANDVKGWFRKMSGPQVGHFVKNNIFPKHHLTEFRVSEDGVLPIGTRLTSSHFVQGQLVDVTGTTKGRGFTGTIKRWNFKSQRASHGVSKAHRKLGSTGQCQDPGKVFKGKKMPGQYGAERQTIQNLTVLRVDKEKGLLYLKGAVPGHTGGYIYVKDAIKKNVMALDPAARPPFPTAVAEA